MGVLIKSPPIHPSPTLTTNLTDANWRPSLGYYSSLNWFIDFRRYTNCTHIQWFRDHQVQHFRYYDKQQTRAHVWSEVVCHTWSRLFSVQSNSIHRQPSPQYIYNRIPLNTTSYEKMTWYATKLLGKTSSWTHSWAMLLLLPIQVNVVEKANKRYKLCWWTTLSSAPRRQVNQPAYCDDKQTINRYAVHMCVRLLLLASWGKSSTTPKYIFVSGGSGEYFG